MANPYKNRILARIKPGDLRLLEADLEPVDLPLRRELEASNRHIEHAYFLEHGLASVVFDGGADRSIEVGLIGREGVTAIAVILGTDRSPNRTFMQIAGGGHRIAAGKLRAAAFESASLRQCLTLFSHAFLIQVSGTALVNGRGKIEERLARWLLMAQDRVENDLPLTHEFLSLMLGVRRPGVSIALQLLEKRGLIKRSRRAISVIDRKGLIDMSKGGYGPPEAEFARHFG